MLVRFPSRGLVANPSHTLATGILLLAISGGSLTYAWGAPRETSSPLGFPVPTPSTHGLVGRPEPSSGPPDASPGSPIGNGGQVPQDVVAADFNQDGIPDLAIAFAFEDRVRWFYGRGDGTFAFQGEAIVGEHPGDLDDLPRALKVEDFDEDGFVDLAVLCSGNPNAPFYTSPSLGILYGTPTGGFEPFQPIAMSNRTYAPIQFSVALSAGMINRDDRIDLVVGHFDSCQISIIEQAAQRSWKPPRVYSIPCRGGTAAVLPVDLDFDGAMDLVIVNRKGIQIWRGDGQGNFPHTTLLAFGIGFTAVAPADFDRDGKWDLAVLDGSAGLLFVYVGLEVTGSTKRVFAIPLTNGSGPVDLVRYDADRDGRDDLAVIYLMSGGGDLFLGQSGGDDDPPLVFHRHFPTAYAPRAIAAADFNLDGREDLAIVHEGDQAWSDNEDLVLDISTLASGRTGYLKLESALTPGLQLPAYLARPRGLAWDSKRHVLWTIDRKERRLVRLSPEGETETSFSLRSFPPHDPSVQLLDPTDVAVGDNGDLWLSDRLAARVFRVRPDEFPGLSANSFSTTEAGLFHPSGIAFDRPANRILVSDERTPHVAAFSTGGDVKGTYRIESRHPLLDLAVDEATGRLWATSADDPRTVLVLGWDEETSVVTPQAELGIDPFAKVLMPTSLRSIAADVPNQRLWLLTDSGMLVRLSSDTVGGFPELGPVQAMRELSLLRDIRAVAPEPDGSMLLADGGLLGTLVRVDETGAVRETLALGNAESFPISIEGLCREGDRIHVLDGWSEQVLVFRPDGSLLRKLGANALEHRRARGLHVRETDSHLLVGTPGRLIRMTPEGAWVEEHPIPASAPPGSLSAGRDPGEVTLFSPSRRMVSFLSDTLSLQASLDQYQRLPLRFVPRAAAPTTAHGDGFVLVGSGTPTVATFRFIPPPAQISTCARHWQSYR